MLILSCKVIDGTLTFDMCQLKNFNQNVGLSREYRPLAMEITFFGSAHSNSILTTVYNKITSNLFKL